MKAKYLKSIHVPHYKRTAGDIPNRMDLPKTVTIPMSMHIGAPCTPVVKVGDHVAIGQIIGDSTAFVSAPIHASISGKVKAVDTMLLSSGALTTAVTIESDGLGEVYSEVKPPVITDFDSFIEAVRASGCVGLGGAGFPTAAKLKVDPEKVDYILVNGAECEPYITADTHTMVDRTDRLGKGLDTLHWFYPNAKIIIGIEDNKKFAIESMQELTADMPNVSVQSLPASYPQGGEKVLIYNLTHRVVPAGKLPIDVGCIVINATTLSFIGKYLMTGLPLVTKCVTIDGGAIRLPQNLIVPIGTSMMDVAEACNGLKGDPFKVLYGGPMMGISVPDLEQPILKSTNAVLFLTEKEAKITKPSACIHCGRCVDACPLNLEPTALEHACIAKDVDELNKLNIMLCMECGSCAFVCPAKRNLVESHKLAKSLVKEAQAR
ncbi:MAG: electron transport complex subunit RsxC [Lachnospiraceae bacterium]|nr:electron transport complex subunit RsxC [Lachnospiraceae bacterium]